MASPYPIAYAMRDTGQTLCANCTPANLPLALVLESCGQIYRHDLDPDDQCPCDACGTLCAPDNQPAPEGEE